MSWSGNMNKAGQYPCRFIKNKISPLKNQPTLKSLSPIHSVNIRFSYLLRQRISCKNV